MTAADIVAICDAERPAFARQLEGFRHEIKGMLSSEMLFFCAVSRHLGVECIIESGRARGNSTHVLAGYFAGPPSTPVTSVEYFRYTEDSLIALRRLGHRHENLKLLFGDAFHLLPDLCARFGDSTVLIDGPKGKYALQLAARLLKSPAVRAIFIHDTHGDSEVRLAINELFPETFSSDEAVFVESFRSLDDPCWEVYRGWDGYRDWGPYVRGSRRMQSYGPTLSMILNGPQGIDRETDVNGRFGLEPLPTVDATSRRLRRWLRSFVPRFSEIPWFCRYLGFRLTHRP